MHSKITFAEMREENFRGKELRREIGPWGLFFCRRLHRFPLHLSDFEYWAGNQHVSGHRLKDSVSDVIVEDIDDEKSFDIATTTDQKGVVWPVTETSMSVS